jgi:hypothetical protein
VSRTVLVTSDERARERRLAETHRGEPCQNQDKQSVTRNSCGAYYIRRIRAPSGLLPSLAGRVAVAANHAGNDKNDNFVIALGPTVCSIASVATRVAGHFAIAPVPTPLSARSIGGAAPLDPPLICFRRLPPELSEFPLAAAKGGGRRAGGEVGGREGGGCASNCCRTPGDLRADCV